MESVYESINGNPPIIQEDYHHDLWDMIESSDEVDVPKYDERQIHADFSMVKIRLKWNWEKHLKISRRILRHGHNDHIRHYLQKKAGQNYRAERQRILDAHEKVKSARIGTIDKYGVFRPKQ